MRSLSCALFILVVALAVFGARDRQGQIAVTPLTLGHAHHLGHVAAALRATSDPASTPSGADTTAVCRAVCLALATLTPAPETARALVGVAYLISATELALPASRNSLPSLRPPKVPV